MKELKILKLFPIGGMLVILDSNSNIKDQVDQIRSEFPNLVCELAVENSQKNNIYSGHYEILSKVIIFIYNKKPL